MEKHISKILYLGVFIALFSLLFEFKSKTDKKPFSVCAEYPTDAIEYLLPAANFALYNQFPYFGFLDKKETYSLCNDKNIANKNAYFSILEKAPAIVFPSKPPLYSFSLGLCFKIFGYSTETAKLFNLISLAIMVFFLMKSALLLVEGFKGLFLGLLAVLWLLFFSNIERNILAYDAELLTQMLAVLGFFLSLSSFKKKSNLYFYLFGLTLSALVLAKAYFLIAVLLVFIWMIFLMIKVQSIRAANISFYILGILTLLIPWNIYINSAVNKDISNRQAFHETLKSAAPLKTYSEHKDLFKKNGEMKKEVIIDLMLFHQYQHAIENNYFLITNQDGDYNILNVHNEFCTDGEFHPEWRIVENAFYHQKEGLPKIKKLFSFYIENFSLGLKINIAKILNAMSIKNISFWLSLLLLTISLLSNTSFFLGKPYQVFALACVLNILLVILILYGDIRFVETILPLTNLILLKYLFSIISNFRRRNT